MYLIDGHNLIGQLPDISLDDPDDEAKLVQKLIGFSARQKKKCVVIFDQGIVGGKSRMSTRGVEVIFASPRTNADALMIARIKAASNPSQWVVVSGDQMVLDEARKRKMQAIRSAEFAPLLRPAQAADKDAKLDEGKPADVYLSPAEVDAWLKLFEEKD